MFRSMKDAINIVKQNYIGQKKKLLSAPWGGWAVLTQHPPYRRHCSGPALDCADPPCCICEPFARRHSTATYDDEKIGAHGVVSPRHPSHHPSFLSNNFLMGAYKSNATGRTFQQHVRLTSPSAGQREPTWPWPLPTNTHNSRLSMVQNMGMWLWTAERVAGSRPPTFLCMIE